MPVELITTLVVDQHERASPVLASLTRYSWLSIRTGVLGSGDYAIRRILGIERKTGEDFARSVVDGRLFRQMGPLRRGYRRPLLLVEALTDGSDVLGVPWPALRGALVSVSVAFGVPILRSASPEETAELIATAARQLREPVSIPYVRPGYRPNGWKRRALYILQGLPGVGPRRAAALLAAFGSVEAAAGADAAALARVPGVGRAIATAIREAVGSEQPSRKSTPRVSTVTL
jgi:Fanconi anemia group M protein